MLTGRSARIFCLSFHVKQACEGLSCTFLLQMSLASSDVESWLSLLSFKLLGIGEILPWGLSFSQGL